jgi:uncharacterized membrane protein
VAPLGRVVSGHLASQVRVPVAGRELVEPHHKALRRTTPVRMDNRPITQCTRCVGLSSSQVVRRLLCASGVHVAGRRCLWR